MGSQVVRVDALRSLAFGSISGTYAALGIPFAHTMRIVCISNNTNAELFISFDNINDNLFIPAFGFKLFDMTTNRNDPDQAFQFIIGTQVYVKGSPSSGSVYLEAVYGQGE